MAKVTLSKATFENLVKHLVEVEEISHKLRAVKSPLSLSVVKLNFKTWIPRKFLSFA
ncbi:Uncharacterized [Moorella glycerini]|uniref:Uncharacterized protein n=1 Tax=Neomoorella stamsii TaxID=1266720 RepID=A0A9X7J1Y1_9FIRM|nr:hypothetical protein MOST_22390 [Moorella stamsii]CEP66948.1 Uncharacterized [Moorella glycerini]